IANATVVIRPGLDIKGVADHYDITIPTVDLKSIGTGEGNQNGAAIKDVVMLMMTSLASKAADSPSLPPELRAVLSGNISALTAGLKEKMNVEVQKVAGDLTDRKSTRLNSSHDQISY